MIKMLARCVRDECKRAFSLNVTVSLLRRSYVFSKTLRCFISNTATF